MAKRTLAVACTGEQLVALALMCRKFDKTQAEMVRIILEKAAAHYLGEDWEDQVARDPTAYYDMLKPVSKLRGGFYK